MSDPLYWESISWQSVAIGWTLAALYFGIGWLYNRNKKQKKGRK